ncbi:MAG TPA: MFS transporter, partial [Gemmatimonadaceae bacterium]
MTSLPQNTELGLTRKLAWVSALSFASGLPYGIVFLFVPTYLRDGPGADLSYITEVTSVATFAWTLKFLWAFLIDRFGTRKRWILAMQFALAALLLAAALVNPLLAAGLFAATVIAIAYASATQDIAIDAYTISLFKERELGPANSARVTAYRLAMIASSGLLVSFAGFTSWTTGLMTAAALMLVLFGITLVLPETSASSAQVSLVDTIVKPFLDLLKLP